MPRPAVTVLMPVWNADPAYFRRAVESVRSQTFPDWELLIVEDPSTRSMADIASEFADERIRYLANANRTGFAAQLNRGLHEARAEWIARLDADDVCHEHRLEAQLAMATCDALDVIGSQLEVIDAAGEPLGYRAYPLAHADIVAALRRYNAVAHPAVLFRRDIALAVGGYRTTRYAMVEDYDLWCRIAKHEARFGTHPLALVQYRVHTQASKHRQLRDTLRGTLQVKREHWADRLTYQDRLRMLAERGLLALPASWVHRLFVATQVRRSLPVREGDHAR